MKTLKIIAELAQGYEGKLSQALQLIKSQTRFSGLCKNSNCFCR